MLRVHLEHASRGLAIPNGYFATADDVEAADAALAAYLRVRASQIAARLVRG